MTKEDYKIGDRLHGKTSFFHSVCSLNSGYFITGTDTDVGKTVATIALGVALQEKNIDVGVFKPIQCGGTDSVDLKRHLSIADDLKQINPYFAKEPLSPHLAFKRQKQFINIEIIKKCYAEVSKEHDITLVEGAGGLLVPIKKNYLVVDLIRDLDLEVIIVTRLALGTINHTLLTINQARNLGLKIKGVICNQPTKTTNKIAEDNNAKAIKEYGNVKVLGNIPLLSVIDRKTIQAKAIIDTKPFLVKSKRKTTSIVDDKKYVWHPFTQMKDWVEDVPLVIDRAKGSYLIDESGRQYLDGVSSLWVNVHGHNHKDINQAVIDQVNTLDHSTLLGLSNTPSVDLAKKLVEVTPKGLDKVFYSDSGSTSVEISVKMAYQYWQNIGQTKKRKLVHLANSYHGDTLGSVSVGGIDLFHKVYRDLVIDTIQVDFPDCYRAPKGKKYPDYAFECVEKFEQLLKEKSKDIAAFIVEPIVQGAGGMIVWPKGVLKVFRDLCTKYDVIFIADEVATGFGRTGKMFACDLEAVKPDIMCVAKGLTAGYLPLAATLTTNKIYGGFVYDYKDQKTFFHGHTYTGNPICCAAAIKNIEIFKTEATLAKLEPKINHLSKRLKVFYNLPLVGDVRQCGMMVGIELINNREDKAPFDWQEQIGVKVCKLLRKKGIILRPLGNVIVIMPPLSITKAEITKICKETYWAIKTVMSEVKK